MDLSKTTARELVNLIEMPKNEFALQTCNSRSSLIQDFTGDKDKILDAIEPVRAGGGNDFVEHLLNSISGLINVAKEGNNKKIAVLYTDAWWSALEEFELQECINLCNNYGIEFYTVIYSRLGSEPNGIKSSLEKICQATGGEFFDGITTEQAANNIASRIRERAISGIPCELTFESNYQCNTGNINVLLNYSNLLAEAFYKTQNDNVVSLEIKPSFIAFGSRDIGSETDIEVTLTAINTDFTITNITNMFGSGDFSIVNTTFPFTINEGESENITVRFTPSDSNLKYVSFEIENEYCNSSISASGGFPGYPIEQTLKLTSPNGGENFVVGVDTLITWEGISKSDEVSLEYSIDNGNSWQTITNSTNGLEHRWENIPRPTSNECLVRINQFTSSKVADTIDSNPIYSFDKHDGAVVSVAFSPDGIKMASTSGSTAMIWNANDGIIYRTLFGHSGSILKVVFSLDGTKLITAATDRTVKIWDVDSGDELLSLEEHSSPIYDLSLSPDGSKVASVSWDQTAKIWDINSGVLVLDIVGHDSPIFGVDYSPDGTKIVTGGGDGIANLWDAKDGSYIDNFVGHTGQINKLKFSPDGNRLVTCGNDRSVRIWDSDDRRQLNNISDFDWRVLDVTLSPNGEEIATASWHRDLGYTVRLWDSETGSKVKDLLAHTTYINNVEFSLDGTRIATASDDRTAKIWLLGPQTLQSDVSDAVFSIVAPEASSSDIDMGQEELGKSKDSVLTEFIENTGSWEFNVKEIYFQGADADAFRLVSGIPEYTVEANSFHSSEISFTPKREGIHNAELVIITQADTLIQNITGEGVEQALEVGDLIDFGIVYIGDAKDTLQAFTIENVGSIPITITETKHNFPNAIDFTTLANGGNFTLQPNESRLMDLRFEPSDVGSTSGVLEFYYDGIGSPAVIQLFGEGRMPTISINDYVQEAGSDFDLELNYLGPENVNLQEPKEFEADIIYNGTVLYLVDSDCDLNYSCTYNINGFWNGQDSTLISIPATATEGNVVATDIEISNFQWLDNPEALDFIYSSGSLAIDGVCEEGGVRLFKVGDVFFSMASRPQPFSEELIVQIGLRETLTFDLILFDINGNEVKQLISGETYNEGAYDFTFDMTDVESGMYILRLISDRGDLTNKVIKN